MAETNQPDNIPENKIPTQIEIKPDYTTVQNKNVVTYYNKTGKIIARNKILKDSTFFYDSTGQFIGKSKQIGDKTFYYNQIGLFLGVCDITGNCQDKNFAQTGKIPPLPKIKNTIPYVDMTLINNMQNKKTDNEE